MEAELRHPQAALEEEEGLCPALVEGEDRRRESAEGAAHRQGSVEEVVLRPESAAEEADLWRLRAAKVGARGLQAAAGARGLPAAAEAQGLQAAAEGRDPRAAVAEVVRRRAEEEVERGHPAAAEAQGLQAAAVEPGLRAEAVAEARHRLAAEAVAAVARTTLEAVAALAHS